MLLLMDNRSSDSLLLRVLATLNEAQARWYVAREALRLGHGGVQAMHALTGLSRPPILKGIRELRTGQAVGSGGRVRRAGGGRKCLEVADPELTARLEQLRDENTGWGSEESAEMDAQIDGAHRRGVAPPGPSPQ
jgi:hypothetical protein